MLYLIVVVEEDEGDLILDKGLLFHPYVWSLSFLIPEVPIGTPYACPIELQSVRLPYSCWLLLLNPPVMCRLG